VKIAKIANLLHMAIFNEFGDLDDLRPPEQQYPARQLPRLNTSNFKRETPPANRQPGTENSPRDTDSHGWTRISSRLPPTASS